MSRLHLFAAFGVELEYMIVDARTLDARPIADRILVEDGAIVSELERGPIAWSNELVSHVIELKTNGPVPALDGLGERFAASVREANEALAPLDARLLGTGAHPWFDPAAETVIWPAEFTDVYHTYDRIFGVRGHGWSNLQSVHLNLPFADDDEFGRLHAAIRLLLPLLPALAASSPFLDGALAGPLDARLDVYRHNQDRIPHIVGRLIPEPVFSEAEYEDRIFGPIQAALRPLDPDHVLSKYFVNSRGAIARFDRGSIEIRVLDIQECPAADLAILDLVIAALRALVEERWAGVADQRAWSTERLADIFDGCVARAQDHEIQDVDYLRFLGLDRPAATARVVWSHLFQRLEADLAPAHAPALAFILEHGTLARRLVDALGSAPHPDAFREVYGELATCLDENRQFQAPSP